MFERRSWALVDANQYQCVIPSEDWIMLTSLACVSNYELGQC